MATFLLGESVLPVPSLSVRAQSIAPTSYSGYTGTDVRNPPPAPTLGLANSVTVDPTFGSRILRVTDGNSLAGKSLIPTDAGFTRTFNANSTAIKLSDEQGWSYWLEFNPGSFTVGDGSSRPTIHALTAFDARWEWSAVDPDIMYFLKGSTISKYNKSTGATTSLGGPPTGEPVTYHAAVVGADAWVCSAAGSGAQNSYTKIFCVNPNSTPTTKFIDVLNRTINGVPQTDPNWPTSESGQTIGIHSLDGSAGGAWLGVTFHGQSWGGNGDAVLNLTTNTWSRLTNADYYWSGHSSLGNGKLVNGGGSVDGRDARGAVVRDANDLMNSSKYQFIMQPSSTCCWNDGEHNSWFNSAGNPGAPILFSRYTINTSPWLAWMSEIVLAATDGSNTVWRVAHTHQSGGCYYAEGFAQISNDGRWALFSSNWDGTLGGPAGFGCGSRIDTFIVDLGGGSGTTQPPPPPPPPPPSSPAPLPPSSTGTPVQWTSLVNLTLTNTTLQKVAGCDGCADAGAISAQQITSGDGYVEFTASETATLRSIGLSNGNPGTSLTEIAFAIRLQAGYAEAREFGVYRSDTTFVAGDRLRVAVQSGRVVYSKNGTPFYTSSVAPSYPLLVDTSFNDVSSTITGAVIAASSSSADTTPPTVAMTAPSTGATVSGATTISATASDNVGVTSVQFKIDGANLGSPVSASPYTMSWNTTGVADGSHTLSAEARDAAGNATSSASVAITVSNNTGVTISNVAPSSVTTTSAMITWLTNLPADSQVQYGRTTTYGLVTTVNSSMVASHAQGLSGLSRNTTYHFRVKSTVNGSTAVSGDFTFRTPK